MMACKKCGGEPKLYRVGDGKQFFVVKCSQCGYTPVPYEQAEFLAYKAWEAWEIWERNENNE